MSVRGFGRDGAMPWGGRGVAGVARPLHHPAGGPPPRAGEVLGKGARTTIAVLTLALFVVVTAGDAQIDGDRGVAPIANSGDYEVTGIAVDVAGKTADDARLGGWRLAQRRGWAMLAQRLGAGPSAIGDGALDGLVSAIVVENEQLGPTRYVARLGVTFDRARAARILGISAYADRSLPMLVVPIQIGGGVAQVFEGRSDWQQAWARFRTGDTTLDYVRPAGTGPDSLLLDAGQVERRSRGWWRTILDQYGASDVLIPIVTLTRQWPGGPVIGRFEGRHGPDATPVGGFSLRVGSPAGIPRLLDTGVQRLDALFQQALRSGALDPDASLRPPPKPVVEVADASDPTIDAILADLAATSGSGSASVSAGAGATTAAGPGIVVTLQYDSPSASSVANVESLMRGMPGVRSAQTTSLAIGGVSLMRVSYDGDPAALRAGLEARGFEVGGGGQTLRIRARGGGDGG